jgi:hypothetical protein
MTARRYKFVEGSDAVAYLQQWYGIHSAQYIARHIGCSVNSVHKAASRYGLAAPVCRRPWTVPEVRLLEDHVDLPVRELHSVIIQAGYKRTLAAIKQARNHARRRLWGPVGHHGNHFSRVAAQARDLELELREVLGRMETIATYARDQSDRCSTGEMDAWRRVVALAAPSMHARSGRK